MVQYRRLAATLPVRRGFGRAHHSCEEAGDSIAAPWRLRQSRRFPFILRPFDKLRTNVECPAEQTRASLTESRSFQVLSPEQLQVRRSVREDTSFEAAAALRKGSQTLARLGQARDRAPQSAALTAPEWELLRAFGLNTIYDVRQRMDDRALLAAYDGAPGSLTELLIEQGPRFAGQERIASRTGTRAAQRHGVLLETRIDYDPETLHACVRYTVSLRQREQAASGQPPADRESRFYAVTFDVRNGGVIQREYGTTRQAPGHATAQDNVVRETVAQPIR